MTSDFTLIGEPTTGRTEFVAGHEPTDAELTQIRIIEIPTCYGNGTGTVQVSDFTDMSNVIASWYNSHPEHWEGVTNNVDFNTLKYGQGEELDGLLISRYLMQATPEEVQHFNQLILNLIYASSSSIFPVSGLEKIVESFVDYLYRIDMLASDLLFEAVEAGFVKSRKLIREFNNRQEALIAEAVSGI